MQGIGNIKGIGPSSSVARMIDKTGPKKRSMFAKSIKKSMGNKGQQSKIMRKMK
jgi:hypothetical protein